jgi:hypothetical protein
MVSSDYPDRKTDLVLVQAGILIRDLSLFLAQPG